MKVLDRSLLRTMAGPRSFERGEDYFASGRVHDLVEDDGQIAAWVRGTREYRVKLWADGEQPAYSCTCPIGVEEEFCKHCVAVGLAWLAETTGGKKATTALKPATTMKDVRGHLEDQDKTALIDLILEQAREDDRLRERLLMKTAKKGSRGLDIGTFRRAIDHAVDTGDFVDYRSMYEYTQGIAKVIRSVEDLPREGHANEAIELTEYFLTTVEERMSEVDDSDGYMGGILTRLQELHLAACKKAKPDPEALAKRLFEWELRSDWETFYGAAAAYSRVLGAKGLAVYRKLAEAEWARVPAIGPGQDRADHYGRRFRITSIMEALALQTGNIEALVAVKSRDLSHAYGYLQIAEIYKQARQHDQALEWAERGVKAFPDRTDSRLRDFLAEEYHRRKRHDEAMALMWAEFAESPYLGNYQKLKTHANRITQWPAWREKALAFLREHITRTKQGIPKDRWAWSPPTDHSEPVRIFLWEKDIEAAWREAKEGGCSNDLWMELAANREKEHPEEVLPIYQSQIEPTVNQKNNDAYRDAVELLRKVRNLMTRLGRQAEFVDYLSDVRTAHKPKRNLMKLIDQIRW